jgi:hypothetical protein
VGIAQEVARLHKKGVRHAILIPVWSKKSFVVEYYKFQRQPTRWDQELDRAGWPTRLDQHEYKDWGGRRPKTLRVHVQCATNVNNQRMPIAYAVETHVPMHNPLCNVNLLASRGFTTGLGWIRVVDTDSDSGSPNVLRKNTLQPMSNDLEMPPPRGWLVLPL